MSITEKVLSYCTDFIGSYDGDIIVVVFIVGFLLALYLTCSFFFAFFIFCPIFDELNFRSNFRKYKRYLYRLEKGQEPYIPCDHIDLQTFVSRLRKKRKDKSSP